MTQELSETADREEGRQQGVWAVPFAIAAVLIIPAAVTLLSVRDPGSLDVGTANPTPLGYTWSLSLFIIPLVALAWWFLRHPAYSFQKRSFWRTILALAPLGFILDLLLGNAFFKFPNDGAVLGIGIPARGIRLLPDRVHGRLVDLHLDRRVLDACL
jgi:hypothetical protein